MAKVKINFYREGLDWLDTKFKKNEIDKIITNIPFPSKKRNEKEIEELYKEFFNQAKYILKDSMLIISPKIKLFKKCINGFKIIKKTEVNIGKLNYKILILKKTI
jgi:23S rRNA G2445 N2-methylase RlmL